MPIHYILRENKVTADPNDHLATVIPTASAATENLIDRMVQAGSTLGRAEINAFLNLLTTTVGQMLLEGQQVNLPLASFGVSITGKFTNAADLFDPARHRLNVSIDGGPELRDMVRTQGTTQKDVAPLPEPILTQLTNVTTGQINSTAKSGGLAEIKGDNLKYNFAAADEGIFFVPATGAAAKVTIVSGNLPKTLTFQCPTLTAQLYTVEVRRRFTAAGPLRIGTLPVQVTGVP